MIGSLSMPNQKWICNMRTVIIKQKDEQQIYSVPSIQDWKEIAKLLLSSLHPGMILTLSGQLGAGKTTLVQALADELGAAKRPQSPTFALLRTYSFPSKNNVERLVHVDAYRIENEKDLLALDLDEELADGKSILVTEWPENIQNWIKNRLKSIVEIVIA